MPCGTHLFEHLLTQWTGIILRQQKARTTAGKNIFTAF
jgi:hypothetical protein